ncbi:MAG TPA: hypothetical protein VII06_42060 [Chloroflexota bacterium]|jgi:hypothetical protein
MESDPLPTLALDLDGVIVRPPLGWNVAISRRLDTPPLPEPVRTLGLERPWRQQYWLARSALEFARYARRAPLPGVRDALARLATVRRLVVVSGRRWVVRPLVRRWLARHGLDPHVAAIYLNDVALPSAQFKLWTLRRLGIGEHVDDDGATAYYLASHGGVIVYLCDWPRNRGLPYPPGVRPVPSLLALAERLHVQQAGGASSAPTTGLL